MSKPFSLGQAYNKQDNGIASKNKLWNYVHANNSLIIMVTHLNKLSSLQEGPLLFTERHITFPKATKQHLHQHISHIKNISSDKFYKTQSIYIS